MAGKFLIQYTFQALVASKAGLELAEQQDEGRLSMISSSWSLSLPVELCWRISSWSKLYNSFLFLLPRESKQGCVKLHLGSKGGGETAPHNPTQRILHARWLVLSC